MAVSLFGFTIGKKEKEERERKLASFSVPENEDGSLEVNEIASGGAFATYVDMEGASRSEADLVIKYREMSRYPEVESAIEDIVNEAIVTSREASPVTINMENLNLSDSAKKLIREEFDYILSLLDFRNQGYEIFRKWYIEGRLYYHVIIDEKNPESGVLALRAIDATKIRKIRVPKKMEPELVGGGVVEKYAGADEYYVYNKSGKSSQGSTNIRIASDSIVFSHSGLLNEKRTLALSYLHKAIKPLNQLRMLEDAVVIYRISRAPERRIFYIDVGNLPKIKAEQYLREIMLKYKNKMVYDADTGEVRDDRRHMSMLEDYWLPRREGGRGTEISTLPGGQNLGEMDDVGYFQKKLYKALHVPLSRLEETSGFSVGRASEITRDELKFTRFIERLRARFSIFFDEILERHLLLKGIVTLDDWEAIRNKIHYEFESDSHFSELKHAELMSERLRLLGDLGMRDNLIGTLFSVEYIRKNVLMQSEEDIEAMNSQIEKEKKSGEIPPDIPDPYSSEGKY